MTHDTIRVFAPHSVSVLFADPGCPPLARQSARALYEAGMLAAYVTTFAYRPQRWQGRALRAALGLATTDPARELARRQIGEIPDDALITYPALELARLGAQRLHFGPIVEDFLWDQAVRHFDAKVARDHVRSMAAVYAVEYAALATLRAARRLGVTGLLSLPGVYHRTVTAIRTREQAAFPVAVSAYDAHVRPLDDRRNARRDAELALADRIIVLSSFARRSLVEAGVPEERILVVPLGAPAPQLVERPRNDPLIFLSAGNQSLLKGTHYLLDAWRALKPGQGVELWLVGRMHLPEALLRDLPATVVIRPTVPYPELQTIYRRASALVFPTLCDGFGAVITEAMAHGLPVITTPNCAGPDLITSGEDGLIIPAADSVALAAAMQWCIDNPAALAAMGRRAVAKAASMQWEDYRHRFVAAIREALMEPRVPGLG